MQSKDSTQNSKHVFTCRVSQEEELKTVELCLLDFVVEQQPKSTSYNTIGF